MNLKFGVLNKKQPIITESTEHTALGQLRFFLYSL
jgi:hypothetical protein